MKIIVRLIITLLVPGALPGQTSDTKALNVRDQATAVPTARVPVAPRIDSPDGRARITVLGTRGVDSLSARLAITDTAPVAIAPRVTCGPTRACPPGWDVTVSAVTAPTTVIPNDQRVPVTVRFTNRGSVRSPAAEAVVCYTYVNGQECSGPKAMGDVPAIPPQGAVLVPFVLPPPAQNGSSEIAFLANFDPEHVTGEKKADNNAALSSAITVEPDADLEWMSFDMRVVGGALVASIEVRNPSRIAMVRERSWTFNLGMFCSGEDLSGSVGIVELHDLPARTSVRFEATLLLPTKQQRGLRTPGACGSPFASIASTSGRGSLPNQSGSYLPLPTAR